MMFEEYQDRVGELITGIIQQSDNRYTLVQLRERVEALLPRSEQVWNERYDHGMRVKAVITEVTAEGKGPSIVVSRRNPELIKQLFELEVPEIADELVEIVGVAREPGYRSKIAVISHADGVDPVGACVGPRGSRVRMVVSELRGEKIDIIPYNEEPARFVAKALSPARVREVLVDDEKQGGDRDRPRRPALAGDRPRGPERPPGREADRLEGRHQVARPSSARRTTRSTYEDGEERRRPLRRGAVGRPALPERVAAGLALLRPAPAPGAGPLRDQPGDGARRRSSDEEIAMLADPDADEGERRAALVATAEAGVRGRGRGGSRGGRGRGGRGGRGGAGEEPPRPTRSSPRRPPAEEARAAEAAAEAEAAEAEADEARRPRRRRRRGAASDGDEAEEPSPRRAVGAEAAEESEAQPRIPRHRRSASTRSPSSRG